MSPFIEKIKKKYYNIYVIENKEKKNYESNARLG
jgi:hypothetical protein